MCLILLLLLVTHAVVRSATTITPESSILISHTALLHRQPRLPQGGGTGAAPDSLSRRVTRSKKVEERVEAPLCLPIPHARPNPAQRAPSAQLNAQPKRSIDADGVHRCRLSGTAPTLQYDSERRKGKIIDHDGFVVANSLHAHLDQRTDNKFGVSACALTETNVTEHLFAPRVRPPLSGVSAAHRVYGADGALLCKVLFVPMEPTSVQHGPGANLREVSEKAVRAVADAFEAGATTPDEKTGDSEASTSP